ncbi:MAG: hypothetical protein K0Q73_586 [Paenibacillus sp.]|jgi:hypothetical protein|nr:hypothetical protein [Paenibacillus sp.]
MCLAPLFLASTTTFVAMMYFIVRFKLRLHCDCCIDVLHRYEGDWVNNCSNKVDGTMFYIVARELNHRFNTVLKLC